MKTRFLCALVFCSLLLLSAFSFAQSSGNVPPPSAPIAFTGSAPGSCVANQTFVNTTTGALYTCAAGVPTLATGSTALAGLTGGAQGGVVSALSPSGTQTTVDPIIVTDFLPASNDVGAAIVAAMAKYPGGNYSLAGLSGNQLAYANTLPGSLMATGSTRGGKLILGNQVIYIDGPPNGTITGCSRTGATVTINIATLGNIAPPIVGSYIQVLGMAQANCSPFNNTSTQSASPQLWQVTASTATSISFLSTASGSVTQTTDVGTWQQVCFSDGFGSCMMTPGFISPAKFGNWEGEGRGSSTAAGLNSNFSFCTGAGTPNALCNFAPPTRSFTIASITFSCSTYPCQPSGTNPLNTATIVLNNSSGTSCGGAAGGCTAVATTATASTATPGLTFSGTTATATTTTNHGLFPGTSWVSVSGLTVGGVCVQADINIYSGYFQVVSTPTPTTFTYVMGGTPNHNCGTGGEIDPHPANIFLGELAKWKGCTTGVPPAGCINTGTVNGDATINEQEIPSSPIRSITNANPPTSSTQTTIVIAVPAPQSALSPWLAANNCTSLCGTIVLGTPVIGEGGAVSGGETATCAKSSCYAVNQIAGFGNKFYNLGIDCQGVEGCIGFQNMYGNEGSGWDTFLIQSAAIACVDHHGQLQNGGPFLRLECLYPTATNCDYGTTGLSISEVPGFSSASLTEYIRSTVNLPSACAHKPAANYVIDSANVHMDSYYGSRTGGTSTFDVFLIGQNSTGNNFNCTNCQGGATAPGNGPSNAVFHISSNSSTASGPATGDYTIQNSQVNGNGTNLSIADDVLQIYYAVAGNPNIDLYAADSTKGYGTCGLVTTIPELSGSYTCRKAVVAITAGQLLCNDGTTAGQVVVCGAATGSGTAVGVAYNSVPASAIGSSVMVQTTGKVTSIVDTAGSCTLNAIVLVGPTTGGKVTCGAFSAGTTLGTSITTGTVSAAGSLTYNLALR